MFLSSVLGWMARKSHCRQARDRGLVAAARPTDDLDRIVEKKTADVEKISQDDIDKMFD